MTSTEKRLRDTIVHAIEVLDTLRSLGPNQRKKRLDDLVVELQEEI